MNYTGFIKPTITKEHYVLGGSPMPFIVHKEDANWTKDLPEKEIQTNRFIDTSNCTAEGTTNQIEIYMREVFGLDVNYSARWVGIIAGTRPPGNDPQRVYEAIREYGLIPEEMLPFDDSITTIEEYYSFKGADEAACYAAAAEWKKKYDFYHEWAFGDGYSIEERINNMKMSLKTSPLCIAVYAWAIDERGVYVKLGDENHWTCCPNFEELQKVFDTYDPVDKTIDQEINFCKRIYIKERAQDIAAPTDTKNWFIIIINFLKYLFYGKE